MQGWFKITTGAELRKKSVLGPLLGAVAEGSATRDKSTLTLYLPVPLGLFLYMTSGGSDISASLTADHGLVQNSLSQVNCWSHSPS